MLHCCMRATAPSYRCRQPFVGDFQPLISKRSAAATIFSAFPHSLATDLDQPNWQIRQGSLVARGLFEHCGVH